MCNIRQIVQVNVQMSINNQILDHVWAKSDKPIMIKDQNWKNNKNTQIWENLDLSGPSLGPIKSYLKIGL